MTENNISDAAVDAAVGAHCEGTMRAALEAALPFLLEAAAPHMLAEAFDHGRSVEHYCERGWSVDEALKMPVDPTDGNPYRAIPEESVNFTLSPPICRAESMGM